MAAAAPLPPPVPIREGDGGVLLVANTRVTLDSVVSAFRGGATPEDIATKYPSLNLPDVYSVVTYDLWNTASIDAYMARRRQEIDALRIELEAQHPQEGIRARLMARRDRQTP